VITASSDDGTGAPAGISTLNLAPPSSSSLPVVESTSLSSSLRSALRKVNDSYPLGAKVESASRTRVSTGSPAAGAPKR
jgi:hypothetical protein